MKYLVLINVKWTINRAAAHQVAARAAAVSIVCAKDLQRKGDRDFKDDDREYRSEDPRQLGHAGLLRGWRSVALIPVCRIRAFPAISGRARACNAVRDGTGRTEKRPSAKRRGKPLHREVCTGASPITRLLKRRRTSDDLQYASTGSERH